MAQKKKISFADLDDVRAPIIAITEGISDDSDRAKMISKKGDSEPVDVTATIPMEDWPEWAVPKELKSKWLATQKSPEQRAVKEMVSGADLKKMKSQKGEDEDMPSWIKGKKK